MTTTFSPREHAPLVRWFWRDEGNDDFLRREIKSLSEKGYGGLVLTPPSFPSGYLGAEWMRRLRVVAAECRIHGLIFWLADDWKMPSGSGELLRAAAQNSAWSLRFQTENLSRETAAFWQTPHEEIFAAWVAPRDDKKVEWREARDLLSVSVDERAKIIASFNEDVQLISFFTTPQKHDIDRLLPNSAPNFLQLTHKIYRSALSEFFGDTIRGFWTSGPALPQIAPDELPWSPFVEPAFQAQHGYDLKPRLAALIAPWGDDSVMVRQHFWQTVSDLLRAHWWLPMRSWCEENGLQLVLWPRLENDESFNENIRGYGDLSATLKIPHRIFIAAESKQLMSRLAASTAAVELQAPPLAIWPENMTPQDRLPALNQLWQHGVGDHICAQDEATQPYANHIQDWNLQLGRIGQWLAESQPAGRVGVLLSTRSVWAHYHPKGHRLTRWIWEDYLVATNLLDELHLDFCLLEESDVLRATLQNGQLLCGSAKLPIDVLVVPGVTTMHWDCWRKLKSFVDIGGKVICLGLLPRWSEKGRDEELEHSISQTTMLTVSDLYEHGPVDIWSTEESSAGFPITRQNEKEGRWACYQPSHNADADDARLRVRQMLKDCLPMPLECQSLNLRFARRETARGNLFFLANSGTAQEFHLRLRAAKLSSQSALWKRDPQKMQPEPYFVWSHFSENEGGGMGLDLALKNEESLCLEWLPEEQSHLERASFEIAAYNGRKVSGYATSTTLPKILLQRDGRFFSVRGDGINLPLPILLPDDWQARRMNSNLLRLGEWILTGETFRDKETGLEWHSSFFVSSDFNTETSNKLWFHSSDRHAQVFLNGEALPVAKPPFVEEFPWLVLNGVWFTVEECRAGHNSVSYISTSREEPQVLLAGDFDFDDNDALTQAHNLELFSGSWHEQGMPFYVGVVDYQQKLQVPKAWSNCRVWLEIADLRESAALYINGVFCGSRLTTPWRFEVTVALRLGDVNTVNLHVANTNRTLISQNETPPSGLLGPVRLVAYPLVKLETKG